jgi:hypothetical protein
MENWLCNVDQKQKLPSCQESNWISQFFLLPRHINGRILEKGIQLCSNNSSSDYDSLYFYCDEWKFQTKFPTRSYNAGPPLTFHLSEDVFSGGKNVDARLWSEGCEVGWDVPPLILPHDYPNAGFLRRVRDPTIYQRFYIFFSDNSMHFCMLYP